jgi:hypothetical protein
MVFSKTNKDKKN